MASTSKIIYVSSVTEQKRFDNESKQGLRKGGFQNQKFHNLMVNGLRRVCNSEIHVVSTPIKSSKKIVTAVEETVNSIVYHHIKTIKLPILSQIIEYFQAKRTITRLLSEDSVILCNAMDEFITFAAINCAKKKKIKIVGIVTDVPGLTSGANQISGGLRGILLNQLLKKSIKSVKQFDGYLLLASAMNRVVNIHQRPSIVIEGLSDTCMATISNQLYNKSEPKVIMYAGSIHRQYGVPMLVNAFLKVKPKDCILVIYGSGNYRDELIEICKHHASVVYKGIATNDVIIKEQIRATLLVNPRPTNEDFVRYSFPSKIMECMASGTPLLTTRIPSMPSEYYKHVYLFDIETEIGFAKTLEKVLNLNQEELYQKGQSAKNFILLEKGQEIQAKKLFDFLNYV